MMIEIYKHCKKAVVATLMGFCVLATSACGLILPPVDVSHSSEAGASMSEPAKGPVADTPTILKNQGIEKTGKILSNTKGEYPEVSLTPDSVLMEWDESKNSSTQGITKGWTKQEVEEAQQFASSFLVNKMIDSPVNGDPSLTEQWVKENEGMFLPEYRDELVESARNEDQESFLFKESWHNSTYAKSQNFGYVYDGATPRIKSLNLEVVSSENLDDQGMNFHYAGHYTMNITSNAGKGVQYTEVEDVGIAVAKEKDKLSIGGIYTTAHTAKNN